MDSVADEDGQYSVCQKACFAASALGYNALVDEKVEGYSLVHQISFQTAIGNKIEGDWCKSKKDALYSVCIKFNEQAKPNG